VSDDIRGWPDQVDDAEAPPFLDRRSRQPANDPTAPISIANVDGSGTAIRLTTSVGLPVAGVVIVKFAVCPAVNPHAASVVFVQVAVPTSTELETYPFGRLNRTGTLPSGSKANPILDPDDEFALVWVKTVPKVNPVVPVTLPAGTSYRA